jgi:1,2-diacylglycerol 3-beta-glucosyltransferase
MNGSVTYSGRNVPNLTDTAMKNVLIVEDEAIISFGYRLQLEQMGREVMGVARSSEEAEELLAQRRPDVIIMDVYLKGPKNGLELAKEIHAKEPIPIIFLTASARPEVVEGIRALNGCHYLLKPVDHDSLFGLLNAMAQGNG